jgi:hypothetical protein
MGDTFTTKLKMSGYMYIPRRVGAVSTKWTHIDNYIKIIITPCPDSTYKKYCYVVPPNVIKLIFNKTTKFSIKVRFYYVGGYWEGFCKVQDNLIIH